jgi:hypothetical protein
MEKMKREKTIFALILILVSLFLTISTQNVSADGMVVPAYYQQVYLPSQKAAIFWNGSQETMILSTRFATDNLTDMVWVVPVPSKTIPEIEKGDIQIFYDLSELFTSEESKSVGDGWDLGPTRPEKEVQVIKAKKIDIYDITILKATNASKLVEWLNEHGYATTNIAIPVLQDYCDRSDFYFIANKVNLTNEYKNLSITQEDRECADHIHIPEWVEPERIDHYMENRFVMLNELEEYKNASFEAVKVLVELKRGIATPIKIIFQPEKPFYPLKISSINNGSTEINVYVFSEKPVKDQEDILSLSYMVKADKDLKEKFNLTNENYITLLKYSGDLKDLNKDSLFISTEYDPKLNPNYIPLTTRILYFILPEDPFIFLFFFFPIPIVPLLFIALPFICIYFYGKERVKNKEFYLPLFLIFITLLIIIGIIIGIIAIGKEGEIETIPIIWGFLSVPMISLLDGFYASHKNSKKWVWITILPVLIIYSFIML